MLAPAQFAGFAAGVGPVAIPQPLHVWTAGSWTVIAGPIVESVNNQIQAAYELQQPLGGPYNIVPAAQAGHDAWLGVGGAAPYFQRTVPTVALTRGTVAMVITGDLTVPNVCSVGGVTAGVQNYIEFTSGVYSLFLGGSLALSGPTVVGTSPFVVMFTWDLSPASGSRLVRYYARGTTGVLQTASTSTATVSATDLTRVAVGAAEGIGISRPTVTTFQVSASFVPDADGPALIDTLWSAYVG